jgi:hypothetical protein
MKQIDVCFERFFAGKKQLKNKWQLQQPNQGDYIVLFHYNHMIMMIDPDTLEVTYQWYECPADKRGLDAAIAYLDQNRERLVKEIEEQRTKVEKKLKE